MQARARERHGRRPLGRRGGDVGIALAPREPGEAHRREPDLDTRVVVQRDLDHDGRAPGVHDVRPCFDRPARGRADEVQREIGGCNPIGMRDGRGETTTDHVDERRQRAGPHRAVRRAQLGYHRHPRPTRSIVHAFEREPQVPKQMPIGRIGTHHERPTVVNDSGPRRSRGRPILMRLRAPALCHGSTSEEDPGLHSAPGSTSTASAPSLSFNTATRPFGSTRPNSLRL